MITGVKLFICRYFKALQLILYLTVFYNEAQSDNITYSIGSKAVSFIIIMVISFNCHADYMQNKHLSTKPF